MGNPKKLAVITAHKSNHTKARLGAVLVAHGKVVCSKPNLPAVRCFSGLCAEKAVLRNAPKCGKYGGILFVARIWADGTMALAKPCPTCMAYLKNCKIKEVHYTVGPNEWATIKFSY